MHSFQLWQQSARSPWLVIWPSSVLWLVKELSVKFIQISGQLEILYPRLKQTLEINTDKHKSPSTICYQAGSANKVTFKWALDVRCVKMFISLLDQQTQPANWWLILSFKPVRYHCAALAVGWNPKSSDITNRNSPQFGQKQFVLKSLDYKNDRNYPS